MHLDDVFLLVRREVIEEVGGYDNDFFFMYEITDWCYRITNKGYKILPCCNQEGIVMSPAPSSFYSFIKQRLRFASKGKSYYGLNFIKMDFKLSLLLIYITNFLVLISQFNYLISLKIIWLIPFLLKVLVDLFFLRSYSKLLKIKFANFIYLFNALWHPSYIVFFGLFGPFIKIDWKGRKTKPIA